MKFVNVFQILKDQEVNYILFTDFIKYLKQCDSHVRQDNVKQALLSFKSGLSILNGLTVVPVSSVLKYSFKRHDSSKACQNITKIVENDLITKSETHSNSLDLYKLLAKTKFSNIEFVFQNIPVSESDISSLIIEHKPHFSDNEWRKIVWFEHHFCKSVEYDLYEQTYENIISLKFSKYQSLLSLKNYSEELLNVSHQQIRDKSVRIEQSDECNAVEILASKRHLPLQVENDILSLFNKYVGEDKTKIICYDTEDSQEGNGIKVVVVVISNFNLQHIHDLCQRVFYFIRRKHDLNIEEIQFANHSHLKQYVNDDNYSRFLLRDDIETRKVDYIFWVWNSSNVIDDLFQGNNEFSLSEKCQACFGDKEKKSLSLKKFDILQEWYFETPAETQLLLEVFINKSSLRKTHNDENLVKNKLCKLYQAYDTLLNILNKNFIGIHQQANTEELLIEYKYVSSVFDVTSSFGGTSSLSHADSKLRRKSTEDMCYYNTYLKQHSFQYKTITGIQNDTVSLRQCHLILMLDNLVRLTYKHDPNPGESRSNQICTLPITLQGLPLQAEITSKWHAVDCDGSEACPCKQPTQLKKEDTRIVLLDLQPQEKHVHNQFKRLMTWGTSRLWAKLSDEILSQIDDELLRPSNDLQGQHSMMTQETNSQDGNHVITDESEDDIDLCEVLNEIEGNERQQDESIIDCNSELMEDDGIISDLEMSFQNVSMTDDINVDEVDTNDYVPTLLSSFGFRKFIVPPLLCRHPPPAIGRDDDLHKIKQILDDVLQKMGYITKPRKMVNRILCGPDSKVGKSLLKLMEMDSKYQAFLPEFPLLHLRKSQVTILFSAYKDAGLIQLLQYMRDEKGDDWKKLASAAHIDTATKFVRRIALALHLSFMVAFARTLDDIEKESFLSDMDTSNPVSNAESWSHKYGLYLQEGSRNNATFALHVDMMRHCDSVIAVSLAERLGGPDGYSLLLATVKDSLCFSFVNNATSYAPYCVKLIYEHYRAGHYHQELKKTLFSTPFKESDRNFSSDTKREMDHLDAIKGFRSGSNIQAITCRMSLIDSLNEVRDRRPSTDARHTKDDKLGWEISDTDLKHILPTTELILRQGGLSLENNDIPRNVYTKAPICLPQTVLDTASEDTGKYLLMRYLVRENMFDLQEEDLPSTDAVHGPKDLISRAARSKGITIKRNTKSKVQREKTERELKEVKRTKEVEKETKRIDCISSATNACQSFLKPDSSKPKVMKSVGMLRAIRSVVSSALNYNLSTGNTPTIDIFINLAHTRLPKNILQQTSICLVEFAGMKFKSTAVKTGQEYIKLCETFMTEIVRNAPLLHKLVICEEKYGFTPDDLKASTRSQRKSKIETSINHLKLGNNIITEKTFDRDALTKTDFGKKTIGTYLAKKIDLLTINANLELIIDSELHSSDGKFCTPISKRFHQSNAPEYKLLQYIHQKKGEAEMAVADWLIHFQDYIDVGQTATILVTSGDIDAVYITLYVVSRIWKRDDSGKFINPVFTVLQKPQGKYDSYNITSILELLEEKYDDREIGTKLALTLCLGGNDFFPKSYHVSHESFVSLVLDNNHFRNNLYEIGNENININTECFKGVFKSLHCPKRYLSQDLSYNDVRAISIGKVADPTLKSGYRTTDPRRWLPPESAMDRLAELFTLQIKYLQTAGIHDAELPKFCESKCLRKCDSGEVEFDLGPEAHFENISELPVVPVKNVKRSMPSTPQHGARRKRQLTSTPKAKCNIFNRK